MELKEEWRNIKDYPNYQVSNLGNVKSKERYTKAKNNMIIHRKEKLLKQLKDNKGYMYVRLYNLHGFKNIKVHRLVANAFITNIENKPQINHIDGNKQNNNKNNLEFVTNMENMQHAIKNNLIDQKLRKENMRKLGKSKKALMKRWHPEIFESMQYKVN